MADETTHETESTDDVLEGGSYEVIRARLLGQAQTLLARADELNRKRTEEFGGVELKVVANVKIRTENNCIPRDIIQVQGRLLFGYNVFIGLKTETVVEDVYSLHSIQTTDDGSIELQSLALGDGGDGFLTHSTFIEHFSELYRYYKSARLRQLVRSETQLLSVFQTGGEVTDVRVLRWSLDAKGVPIYVDNRGERDYVFPPQHDFEWVQTTREDHVQGTFPHVSIKNKVFVETTGGDLTIKVEDNTASGEGIYAELVEDANQTLDDAEFLYAEIGPLILLRIKPYREETWRHLVFSTRSHSVVRIDAIGWSCISLPEDHGIIFPGGCFLQDGQYKVFEGDFTDFEFIRSIRSPNGEDVLYVFHHRVGGSYVLFPYNLIRREVQTPIRCNGYSLFDNGMMIVFRFHGDEPTKVHPMQIWQTPFVSAEFAASEPISGSPLATIGNAELVRGISDCRSIARNIEDQPPSRQIFEDLIANVQRALDAYSFWLGTEPVGNLQEVLEEIRETADLIIDEYDKVVAIREQADRALADAEGTQQALMLNVRPETWERVDDFMNGLTDLRKQRGHLITLRELRHMDLQRVEELEREVVEAFDRLSKDTVGFLLRDDALAPLSGQLEELLQRGVVIEKTHEMVPLFEDLARVSDGLNVLSEVSANLQVDDPTARTRILEGISEVFAHQNRVRATIENRRRELLTSEGQAEFSAQFKLFAQSVQSAIALCDTPEKCDEHMSRLMVQLEELEAKFSEFDEFIGELATKREEVYEAFGQKKQQLLDERQRRVQNLWSAAERILQGVARRAGSFKEQDELNAYFASDPMILKVRELAEKILELGDSVKADEVQSRLKSSRQDALRGLRDRLELFDGDVANLIKLGQHRFSVNTQPLELTILPHGDGEMAVSLSGTDFVEPIDDEVFNATRAYWSQQLISETQEVYRGEYLAATILFDAEAGRGASIETLHEAQRAEGGLLELVRKAAANRYQEGYDRGVHDHDAAKILEKLITIHESAGLLRFAPTARALAVLFWAFSDDERKPSWLRRAQSFGRLKLAFQGATGAESLTQELQVAIEAFVVEHEVGLPESHAPTSARYLVEELAQPAVRFTTSSEAQALVEGLWRHLDDRVGGRRLLEDDMRALKGRVGPQVALSSAWLNAFANDHGGEGLAELGHVVTEAAVLIVADRKVDREPNASLTTGDVTDLLGQHPRIHGRTLKLRIDEFLERLGHFKHERVPGYQHYRDIRSEVVERQRARLRVDEYKPRVLSAFVRNKLINDVYLPLIGDNLAKQLGAAGEGKRTDLMGMLLLISPPGYGKTTLMEYVASRLGLAFVKVNGPSLGHSVTSLDPTEAPNATARQEVEKINLAFEMGNNVMLYLDDIQHTHPELLQKFISLCDAQRRIEGVWKGRTQTYDLRGKKFCVVMAGNPYTESGDKFQIPDMLANRADTYNLGDILSGKDDLFALSYIENAITSNPVLAPLATREQGDIYKLVDMARGRDVPTTDLNHGYSTVEINEIKAILQRLFVIQDVLLRVNQEYIRSASMDDNFRTEPRFQLQGSYRNMNKLTEKVVSAMNEAELERLIDDHYAGESQTLTSGAEANLLKFAELRGVLSEEQAARWEAIKHDFKRIKMMGGGDDDPVTRVTSQLAGVSDQLEGIQQAVRDGQSVGQAFPRLIGQLEGIERAVSDGHRMTESIWRVVGQLERIGVAVGEQQTVAQQLAGIESAVRATVANGGQGSRAQDGDATIGFERDRLLVKYLQHVEEALHGLASPRLEVNVNNAPPPGVEELLAQQVAIIERTLVPLVRTVNGNMGNPVAIDAHIQELIGLLRSVDARLREGRDIGLARTPRST